MKNATGSTGLQFIDKSPPEELVHLVNSGYLSLCTSHQMGSSKLNDLEKLCALLVQCESDFIGRSKVRVTESAIQNGLLVLCLVGLSHNMKLWPKLNWSKSLASVVKAGKSEFAQRLVAGLQTEKTLPKKGKKRVPDISA